jgi:hypothetical protein
MEFVINFRPGEWRVCTYLSGVGCGMKFFPIKDTCQSYPIFRRRWKQWLILEPT